MPPHGGLRLHVVTAAPPAVRTREDLTNVAGAADLIELRFDLLAAEDPTLDVAAWVAASPRPVLATVRSRAQGGAFAGTPADAAALLTQAAQAGAAWIDVEARVAPHLGDLPDGTRRVASEHGPADPEAGPQVPGGYDLVKIARPIDDAAAFTTLLGEAAQVPSGAFVVPYGRLAATRTLFAGADRPSLLFGSARADAPAAEGQPPLDVLLEELRAGEVGDRAALYGLVGDPPGPSPSPALHNAVFRARDVDALYVPLPGMDLEEALGMPVEGLSVTHPHKQRAYEIADAVDPVARAVGAVNTLVRRAQGWWGGNSDALGLRAVLPDAPAGGAEAFVYGAGGYARAALWALGERGYTARITARHEQRGMLTAIACGVPWAGARYERSPHDAVVVNATPCGADGAEVAAFAGASLAGLTVLDAPYRAAGEEPTGLIAQARRDGARRIVDGRALLAAQARDQALAFGADAGDLDLERVLAAALEPPRTLVLLGTRGAGKTAVGRAAARRLGRPFVDLDAAVERITGRSPARWIESQGWDAFRRVEAEALERAAARRGIVLATGGGVVEHAPNHPVLRAAGLCVLLAVEPEIAAGRLAASPGARPRIAGAADALAEARLLVERRTPHWSALAEHTVDANNALDDVVAAVVRCWV